MRNDDMFMREIIMDDIEMMADSIMYDRWKECVMVGQPDPVRLFHRMYKQGIPWEAKMHDGYTDDELSTRVVSFGQFERENLADCMTDYDKNLSKKIFIKNNIFIPHQGKNMINVGGAVSRVELNASDGFLQHMIISGNPVTPDKLSGDALEDVSPLVQKLGDKKPVLLRPQIWSTYTNDVAFGKNKIGKADAFFSERTDFVEAFNGDPITNSEALLMNTAMNGEFIGVETNMHGLMAFNNIRDYCIATGQGYEDVCAITSELIYFAHQILNILIPKQIVLVIDSYRGLIDIPRRDYIPNISDPLVHIPDYNNKINHVVAMMKQLAAGRILCATIPYFYVKLSITPALIIVNFISSLAENHRLVLHLPTVDNQILYNCEEECNVFPAKYLFRQDPHWLVQREPADSAEILRTIGSNYRMMLLGGEQSFAGTGYGNGYPAQISGNTLNPPFQNNGTVDYDDIPF